MDRAWTLSCLSPSLALYIDMCAYDTQIDRDTLEDPSGCY